MTSTSTPRAGLTRLVNRLAALALLLVVAAGASAQDVIYVDTGGNDTNSGTAPNTATNGATLDARLVGPVRTVDEALERVAQYGAETVQIEANGVGGTYAAPTGGFDGQTDGLTFEARNSGTFTQVRFTGGGIIDFSADDLAFTSTGATFLFDAVEFEGGDVTLDGVAFTAGALIVVDGGTVDGAPTFIGSVELAYIDNDDYTTGAELPALFANGSRLTVALDDGGDTDQVLTLDKDVTFGNGLVTVQGENDIDGQITVGGNVVFDLDNDGAGEVGNAGDIVVSSGGTADFSGNDTPEVDSVDNSGTFDFGATTLQVRGDFVNEGTVIGGSIDLNGNEDAAFSPGPGFTIDQLRIGNGPGNDPDEEDDAKTVQFMEDVILDGNFVVYQNATADLMSQAVTLEGDGNDVWIQDGAQVSTDDDGALIFAGSSQTIRGDGMFSNLSVATDNEDDDDGDINDGDDDGITLTGGDLEFDRTIALVLGGIDIDGGDLSPQQDNTDALVVVNYDDDDAGITEDGGTFNDSEIDFDLQYDGDGAANNRTVDDEFFTEYIRNLTVMAEGVLDASGQEGGSISGDVVLTATAPTGGVGADLTVLFPDDDADGSDDDGVAGDDGDDGDDDNGDGDETSIAGMLTVGGDVLAVVDGDSELVANGNVTLGGEIEGDGLLTLGDGVTLTGQPGGNAVATLDIDTNVDTDASATIAGVRTITGDVTSDGDDSMLTLGLGTDGESVSVAPFTFGGILPAGNVDGNVDLDGSLALTTNLEFLGTIVGIDETLALGQWDLQFTAQGTNFDLDDVEEVTATTGYLAFYGDGSTFDGDGSTVPNVRFAADPRQAPGDTAYGIDGDVTITDNFRINAFVDAASFDGGSDFAVTLGDGATFIVDQFGFIGDAGEIEYEGSINLFTAASNGLSDGSFQVLLTLSDQSGSIDTFGAYGNGAIFDGDMTFGTGFGEFVVGSVVVTEDPNTELFFGNADNEPQLDLGGHSLLVLGDVTVEGDNDIIATGFDNFGSDVVEGRGTFDDGISELIFIGGDDAQFNVPSGVTELGDGVDIRVAKSQSAGATGTVTTTVDLAGRGLSPGGLTEIDLTYNVYERTPIEDANAGGAIETATSVTVVGGAVTFDDEFDTQDAEDFDDETLILESGILVVGTPQNQQSVYIRLDHENGLVTQAGNTDNGQGFVFADPMTFDLDQNDATTALPDAYIGGNVRKRIINAGSSQPGRVIFPTGEKPDAADEPDYGPFAFDFESSGSGAAFGIRTLNVTFVGTNPGRNASLPLADDPQIEGAADFYWLVSTTGPAFGQGTLFNIEARSDDYNVTGSSDDIELIRRQSGDVGINPYSGIGGDAQVFQIDLDGNDEGDPEDDAVVVLEQVAQSFLGPQGTIVTFGIAQSTRPVANGDETPEAFAVRGAYPNPFSARSEIAFDLPESAVVTLEVFDVMGREVLSVDAVGLNAGGDHRIAVDGGSLSSGVYVYRLRAEGGTETWVRSGQITLAR